MAQGAKGAEREVPKAMTQMTSGDASSQRDKPGEKGWREAVAGDGWQGEVQAVLCCTTGSAPTPGRDWCF